MAVIERKTTVTTTSLDVLLFIKDPDAKLDYVMDWEDWLDGDTISAVAWTLPAALTEEAETTESTTDATLWVSGGTAGTSYDVLCQITSTLGRVDQRTFKLKIKDL